MPVNVRQSDGMSDIAALLLPRVDSFVIESIYQRKTPRAGSREFPLPNPPCGPTGITPGPDGALWFTEQKAGRIGRISTTGDIREFPLPDETRSPHSIAVGPDGALWYTKEEGNRIGRLTWT